MTEKEEKIQKALGTLCKYKLTIFIKHKSPGKRARSYHIYGTSMRDAKMKVLLMLNSNQRKRIIRNTEWKSQKRGEMRERWLNHDNLIAMFIK